MLFLINRNKNLLNNVFHSIFAMAFSFTQTVFFGALISAVSVLTMTAIYNITQKFSNSPLYSIIAMQ